MSSIIKKSSSRFAPKLTERKQTRISNTQSKEKVATNTIITTGAGSNKNVRIVEPDSIDTATHNAEEDDDDESNNNNNNNNNNNRPSQRPNLKELMFEKKFHEEDAIMDDDDVDNNENEEQDPHKKASTVIINPTKLSSTQKTRRSSSVVVNTGVASFRRGSINDENRRMRRLSSITTGLATGLNVLRRPSVSSSTSSSSLLLPPPLPTRVSISDSTEPYKINIPTGVKPKSKKNGTPQVKSQTKVSGKLPSRRKLTKPNTSAVVDVPDTRTLGLSLVPVVPVVLVEKTESETVPVGEEGEKDQEKDQDHEKEQEIEQEQKKEQEKEQEKEQGQVVEIQQQQREEQEKEKENDEMMTIVSTPHEPSFKPPEEHLFVDEENDSTSSVSKENLEISLTVRKTKRKVNLISFQSRQEQRSDMKRQKPVISPTTVDHQTSSSSKTAADVVVVTAATSNGKTPAKEREKIPTDLDKKSYLVFVNKDGDLETLPKEKYNSKELNKTIKDLSKIPKNLFSNDHQLFNDFTIDEESITMEDLCKPVYPFGEVSDNFELSILASKKKRELLLNRRRLRIEARNKGITYQQLLKEMEDEEILSGKAANEAEDANINNNPSVQLKLSEGGSFDIAEESLFVDRHNTQGVDHREKISENMFETAAISSTYSKRQVTDKWTMEETKMLYKALSSWGTDFSIITQLFPHRTRHQIKLKFNLEEKKRPYIVDLLLKRKLPINFDDYCEQTKQEFKTLEEYNVELKELKEKHELEVREMMDLLEKQRKIDIQLQTKREVELRTGVRSMSRAERRAELRKNETVIGEVKKQED